MTNQSMMSNRDFSKSSQRLKSNSKLVPSLKLKTSTNEHNRTVSQFELSKDTGRTQGSTTVG